MLRSIIEGKQKSGQQVVITSSDQRPFADVLQLLDERDKKWAK